MNGVIVFWLLVVIRLLPTVCINLVFYNELESSLVMFITILCGEILNKTFATTTYTF